MIRLPLVEALTRDPATLYFGCAEERVRGAAVLAIARPGLRLLDAEGEPEVPRAVFHRWMFTCGERLLAAHAGIAAVPDHELDWITQGLAAIAVAADPPAESGDDSPDDTRLRYLSLIATVASMAGIHQGDLRALGQAQAWVARALTWASKRHVRDRRCAVEPPSLCEAALDLHAALARHRAEDPTVARAAEEAELLRSLVEAWRAHLGEGAGG
jgi:hypothetical protein